MIALRSVLFNTIFYANLILRMIVLSPYLFPGAAARPLIQVPKNWALLQPLADGKDRRHDLRNRGTGEPARRGYILAPKHQSFWDTLRAAALAEAIRSTSSSAN